VSRIIWWPLINLFGFRMAAPRMSRSFKTVKTLVELTDVTKERFVHKLRHGLRWERVKGLSIHDVTVLEGIWLRFYEGHPFMTKGGGRGFMHSRGRPLMTSKNLWWKNSNKMQNSSRNLLKMIENCVTSFMNDPKNENSNVTSVFKRNCKPFAPNAVRFYHLFTLKLSKN